MRRLQSRALVSRLLPLRETARDTRPVARRQPTLERLEPRNLLTSLPVSADGSLSSHAGVCSCPVCTGAGLADLLTHVEQGDPIGGGGSGGSGDSGGELPQGTLPLLSS